MELLDIFYLWSVPYMIVEGSLLNLYRWVIVIVYLLYLDIYISTYNSNSRYFARRNGSVGKSDLDFSVELSWWQQQNAEKLAIVLLQHGFKAGKSNGKLGYFGYEESWKKDSVKVDLFSGVFNGSHHTIGFWVYQLYNCSFPMTGVQEVTIMSCRNVTPCHAR